MYKRRIQQAQHHETQASDGQFALWEYSVSIWKSNILGALTVTPSDSSNDTSNEDEDDRDTEEEGRGR